MTKTPNTDPWRPVWNWKGPNRIRHFLWFVAHQKILTNVGWVSRHLTNDATCEHCRTGDETVLHVLRDCQAAADVWNQGPEGWVTLNSDGSADLSKKQATAGGLVRDWQGRCLFTYTMNLGNCSITRAEFRGALEGLERAWREGCRKVLLQMDSQSAISLLTNGTDTNHQHGMEALRFAELQSRDWTVEVRHTYREGYHAADFLASSGYDYPFGSHSFSISSSSLGYFLRYDCMGITEQCYILIND
ncbi:Putative ribonuclease H protein At1g65750 [Linum perenne]